MDFRYLGICGRRRGSIGASLILALVTGGIDRGGYFFPSLVSRVDISE